MVSFCNDINPWDLTVGAYFPVGVSETIKSMEEQSKMESLLNGKQLTGLEHLSTGAVNWNTVAFVSRSLFEMSLHAGQWKQLPLLLLSENFKTEILYVYLTRGGQQGQFFGTKDFLMRSTIEHLCFRVEVGLYFFATPEISGWLHHWRYYINKSNSFFFSSVVKSFFGL